MSEYKSPIPTMAPKSKIQNFATEIADKLLFKPGGNIRKIIEDIGGEIIYDHLDEKDYESGSIIVRAPRNFTIRLSEVTSSERDRFTLAHELGHYFLHYPKIFKSYPSCYMRANRFIPENDSTQSRAEWEANWFAASFLMPEEEFKEIFKISEDAAQKYFKVSLKAIQTRAKSLNLA